MATVTIEEILESAPTLRPLPVHVARILKGLEDPDMTAAGVAELIGVDQALTATLLRMANSEALGYDTSCTTLKDAVLRLGFKRIITLVLGLSATGPLSRRLPGYRIGMGELWNHSVSTGIAAQRLAHLVSYPRPEEAYVGGLLHDVGKLVLDQHILDDYNRMMEMMMQERKPLWEVEARVLGFDHARVGGLISERWNFPPLLSEAIHCHHSPGQATIGKELAAIVNLANSLTSQFESGLTDLYGHFPDPESSKILGLPASRIDLLCETVRRYIADGRGLR